ncbi:MAG: hypothetical protein M1820_006454 [Bogoriella megaspora]|nr:MAG: hypothetical protein M1820_006454 [Bogoriella megaspora]
MITRKNRERSQNTTWNPAPSSRITPRLVPASNDTSLIISVPEREFPFFEILKGGQKPRSYSVDSIDGPLPRIKRRDPWHLQPQLSEIVYPRNSSSSNGDADVESNLDSSEQASRRSDSAVRLSWENRYVASFDDKKAAEGLKRKGEDGEELKEVEDLIQRLKGLLERKKDDMNYVAEVKRALEGLVKNEKDV